MKSHEAKMFSFESHIQLLSVFEMVSPLVFLAASLSIRGMVSFENRIPNWAKHLNNDVMREYLIIKAELEDERGHLEPDKSEEYKLFLAISFYIHLLLGIAVSILLWKSANAKCITRLIMWILCVVILIITGLTLIEPMKSANLLEIGLAVVFVKVSLIYSTYTFIIVICLIFKIKLDEV